MLHVHVNYTWFNLHKNTWILCNVLNTFFCNKIVYLVYRDVLVSFAQGGTGVPCPTLYVFLAPLFIPSARSACGGWWWWAGVYVGFGFWWGWVGIVIPGVLT